MADDLPVARDLMARSWGGARRSGRLLQDEDLHTINGEDVRRWIRIYTELIALQHAVIDDGNGSVLDPGVRHLLLRQDASDSLARYIARRDFWLGRLQQIVGIDIDAASRVIRHGDREARLTRREFQLFEYLYRYPEAHFTSSQLLTQAWHRSDLHAEEIRLYVAQLRRKLTAAQIPCAIVSVPRQGYRLEVVAPRGRRLNEGNGHRGARP
jgi:hypothetical protein